MIKSLINGDDDYLIIFQSLIQAINNLNLPLLIPLTPNRQSFVWEGLGCLMKRMKGLTSFNSIQHHVVVRSSLHRGGLNEHAIFSFHFMATFLITSYFVHHVVESNLSCCGGCRSALLGWLHSSFGTFLSQHIYIFFVSNSFSTFFIFTWK